MTRPNIVYLHSHDTGRYVQPYGHAIATPHLQQLADDGVLFRKAFCAAPTCSPSRAGLLLGQSPHSAGMLGLTHRGFRLTHPGQHLAATLAASGYHTVLAGVQHVGDSDACGYAVTRPDRSVPTEAFAADFLRSRPSQPFFLDAGWGETHRIGGPVDGFSSERDAPKDGETDDRYTLPPPPLPDAPPTRRDMADFKIAASRLDRKIGEVLRAIDESGLRENTLVIATTDHGIAFPGMKCSLTDHGTGVMLILRGPSGAAGDFAGGKVVDAMISQIDVYPTLCEWLGLAPPPWLQGQSFLPLVRGRDDEIHDAIFSEVTFHAAYEPKRAVRTTRWKYVRNYDAPRRPILPNCDDGASKSLWVGQGWREQCVAREQLFDLVFDPQESGSVADDPGLAETLGDLRRRLDAWMEETNDPLLAATPVWPGGLRVNDAGGLSPREPPMACARPPAGG